ncbi:hypothetical protein N7478_009944 [Penicillium angulare]|uniref:uncharacterized protein n=1 Tax=Penicillium angulare TaxID=116970 RepID=UPI00254085A1|nr:uncharacterized protein N7478_009944 [Penicillium angulare]KAJ5267136.1 hypothetical protein N7478_009944 [Penicillium angulare]
MAIESAPHSPRVDCFFELLPTEILEIILDYVGNNSPSSLRALALTSKSLLAVASPFIYRTVTIQLDRESDDEILSQSKRLLQNLQRFNAFSMVRCFRIERRRLDGKDRAISSSPTKYIDDLRQHVLEFPSPYLRPFPRHHFPNGLWEYTIEEDKKWPPVADLIRKMPQLRDLLYGGLTQFAPCLLEALHQSRPSCRLWLNTFKLNSLWDGDGQIDPHELALVSSPCLYSIRSDGFEPWDELPGDHFIFDREAICRIVATLAPCIQEVHVMRCYGSHKRHPRPKHRWAKFIEKAHDDMPKKGSLRYLSINVNEDNKGNEEDYNGPRWIQRPIMELWEDCTDFSILHTLRLMSPPSDEVLDFLSRECSFQSLQELELTMSSYTLSLPSDDLDFITPSFQPVYQFFSSLPPLSTLIIHGWCSRHTFDYFLAHHGDTLTKLVISPNPSTGHISQHHIKQISEFCPNLEELKITIPRNRGLYSEVESYLQIGRIPKLRYLNIELDVTNVKLCNRQMDYPGVSPTLSITAAASSFDNYDLQECPEKLGGNMVFRNGDIREALIDHAIDSALAKSIFETIQSQKGPEDWPLESLDLHCIGKAGLINHPLGTTQIYPFASVLWALKQPWRVIRFPYSDGQIIVQGIRPPKNSQGPERPLPSWLEEPFRRIWPAKQGGSNWSTDWHSLPLDMSSVPASFFSEGRKWT